MATSVTQALDDNAAAIVAQRNHIEEVDPIEATWLEQRRGYIGGSDCAAMFADPRLPSFGKDGIKYGCLRRLVYNKQGVEPDFKVLPEQQENFDRGHDLEPLVAQKFRKENGLNLKVIKSPPHRMSKTHARAGVNLDYQIVGVTDEQFLALFGDLTTAKGPGYMEVKTSNEYVFEEVEKNKGAIPDYVFQVQHGLAVKGWDWGIFAVLGYGAGLWRLSWFTVLADKKLGARILERTDEVWEMVEGKAPLPPPLPQPDPQGRCQDCEFKKSCLGSSFIPALPTDGVYTERPELTELATNYRRLAIIQKKAEDEKKVLAKQILAQVEKNGRFMIPNLVDLGLEDESEPVRLVGGRMYCTIPTLNEKALRAEQPEIAAQYTYDSPRDFVKVWERGKKED